MRDSSMEGSGTEEGGQKVVNNGVKAILLDGRHFCSAVRQRKADGG